MIAIDINLGKPPQNIAPKILFDKIDLRLKEVLQKTKINLIGNPLFKPCRSLNVEQWKKLQTLQNELDGEYDLRREMLITRLDVTVQSFQVKIISSFIKKLRNNL